MMTACCPWRRPRPTAYRRLARAQVIEDGSSSWGPMALVAGRLIVRDTFAHGMHRRGGALIMERSKLLVIAGSLVGAAILIVVVIVSPRLSSPPHAADRRYTVLIAVRRTRLMRRRATSATQADEEAALKAAEPIDPAMIGYHETGTFPVAFREPRALAVDADAPDLCRRRSGRRPLLERRQEAGRDRAATGNPAAWPWGPSIM